MMTITRRRLVLASAALGLAGRARAAAANGNIVLIAAPSNLGLRPPRPGHEPGTWRAPAALRAAGLEQAIAPLRIIELVRPIYSADAENGTRLRNGHAMRRFSETLADSVAAVLADGRFPLVLGGDCSILLGCLLGARRGGACGLIHVDGHSDFYTLRPEDTWLGSAAGMDLALATGRGDAMLAEWGEALTPLVADGDVVQIGEREDYDPDYAYPEIRETAILRIDVREVLAHGIAKAANKAIGRMRARGRNRVWLHIDVDVLDQTVMPAVDSPGSPGLNFDQLANLIATLRASGRIIGADVSIFDPELDPAGNYAKELAHAIAQGFAAQF